jgi:alpha,alpha-trehalose phosphorylase
MLHFPYFDLYRKQVVKQADLVLAMHRRPQVTRRLMRLR